MIDGRGLRDPAASDVLWSPPGLCFLMELNNTTSSDITAPPHAQGLPESFVGKHRTHAAPNQAESEDGVLTIGGPRFSHLSDLPGPRRMASLVVPSLSEKGTVDEGGAVTVERGLGVGARRTVRAGDLGKRTVASARSLPPLTKPDADYFSAQLGIILARPSGKGRSREGRTLICLIISTVTFIT